MCSMSNMVNENCDEIGSIKQHVASTQHDLRTHCDVHKLRNNHDVRDEGAVTGGGVVPDSNPTGIRTTDDTTVNDGSGNAQHGNDGNFPPGNGGNAQPDCSNVQHGNGGNTQTGDASTSAQRGNGGNAQPGDASTNAQSGNGGNAQPGRGVTPPSNDNKDESSSTEGSGAQSGGTAGDGGAIPKGRVSQHGGARRQVGSVKFNNRSNFDEPEGGHCHNDGSYCAGVVRHT